MPNFVPGNVFEENQLLQFLWYHMQPEMRRKVREALPVAYNNYVATEPQRFTADQLDRLLNIKP